MFVRLLAGENDLTNLVSSRGKGMKRGEMLAACIVLWEIGLAFAGCESGIVVLFKCGAGGLHALRSIGKPHEVTDWASTNGLEG